MIMSSRLWVIIYELCLWVHDYVLRFMSYELWFMIMGRSLWVMFVSYDYELLYMSLDCEFTITVGVYDLWINTAAIRKYVRFYCVGKAGRRSYPLKRPADLGLMLVICKPVHANQAITTGSVDQTFLGTLLPGFYQQHSQWYVHYQIKNERGSRPPPTTVALQNLISSQDSCSCNKILRQLQHLL